MLYCWCYERWMVKYNSIGFHVAKKNGRKEEEELFKTYYCWYKLDAPRTFVRVYCTHKQNYDVSVVSRILFIYCTHSMHRFAEITREFGSVFNIFGNCSLWKSEPLQIHGSKCFFCFYLIFAIYILFLNSKLKLQKKKQQQEQIRNDMIFFHV